MVAGNIADAPDKVDRVYDVNPTGTVQKGTKITVKYYVAAPSPDAPTTAPTVAPATAVAGTDVVVTWTAQSCPSGQTLTGYEVLVEGTGATSPAPSAPDATTATITTGPGAGTFTVKFRYLCGGFPSEYSTASTPVVVTAAP
jgi:serine/threonine-protein kinase